MNAQHVHQHQFERQYRSIVNAATTYDRFQRCGQHFWHKNHIILAHGHQSLLTQPGNTNAATCPLYVYNIQLGKQCLSRARSPLTWVAASCLLLWQQLAAGMDNEEGKYLPHGWKPFSSHRWLAEYLVAHKPQTAATGAMDAALQGPVR